MDENDIFNKPEENEGVYYTPPTADDDTANEPVQEARPDISNESKQFEAPYVNTPVGQPSPIYNYEPNPVYNQQYNPYPPVQTPPKKSAAPKVIAIILAVCIVVAGIALVAGVTHKLGTSGNALPFTDSDDTEQSEDTGEDVKLYDSDEVATSDKNGNLTVAGVAEECMDSCVGITVYTNQSIGSGSYFYSYGNGGQSDEPTLSGEGSGIIMKEAGSKTYILTCAHVISDGDSFTVTLNDGTELEAQMVAYDSQTDIGVLSVNETGLKVAEFADSDQLVVGEQVVAIGCPGGLEFMNSVASGYISALSRPISSSIGYDNECIQTDTAINPGNSGGGLFNMQGQVVGVNSSKIASTEYEGMGFAVPSSTAIATANSLIANGYVSGRAKLGIQYNPITSFSNASSVLSELEKQGYKEAEGTMVIQSIDSDSDLASKDIQEYDMIVAVNGNTMTSTDVMTSILADSSPGDTITLTIARIDNNSIKTFDVECTLIESKG